MNVKESFSELLDLVDARLPQKPDGTPNMERAQSKEEQEMAFDYNRD